MRRFPLDGPAPMWTLAAVQGARLAWAAYQRHAIPVFWPVPGPAGGALPSVSLLIPARDEAAGGNGGAIGSCLAGARAQTYPNLEIVVIDDQSQDATPEIVAAAAREDARVRLVRGAPLPAGWKGKCWALHQGAAVARGAWLLFVDADTRLRAGAVAGAIDAALTGNAAVLSALTFQELPTWWERLVQPAVIAALAEAMPVTLVNDPRLPKYAIANGQFLLVRRDAYDGMGGHEAIRGEIAEDAQLARRAKLLGYRFLLGDGRALASTRMYTSPGALWEGWTKNLHTGVRLLPWLVPPGVLLNVVTLVAPFWSLAQGVRRRDPAFAAAGLAQLGGAAGVRRLMDGVFGVPWQYTLAQPAGQAAFLVLLLASFAKVLSGRGVTWKGRRYAD